MRLHLLEGRATVGGAKLWCELTGTQRRRKVSSRGSRSLPRRYHSSSLADNPGSLQPSTHLESEFELSLPLPRSLDILTHHLSTCRTAHDANRLGRPSCPRSSCASNLSFPGSSPSSSFGQSSLFFGRSGLAGEVEGTVLLVARVLVESPGDQVGVQR